MHIEKIDNIQSAGEHIPGLVDLFLDEQSSDKSTHPYIEFFPNIHKHFANEIQQLFTLGTLYGSKGVSIDLVCSQPSDIYYEICPKTLQSLPKNKIKYFLQNYNVIIHDYIEGSWWFNMSITPVEFIRSLNILPRNVILSTTSGDNEEVKELNIKSGFFPLWLISRYSDLPKGIEFNFNPKKLALIPARKARSSRVMLLAKMHEKKLLDDCDWSLVINFNEDGEVGDFFTSPALSHKRFNLMETSDEPYIKNFFNRYRKELPKVFEEIPHDSVADCRFINASWLGSYNYYISTEPTLGGSIHATEKTWNGMGLGLPVITLASAGFNTWLESLGFKTIGDFDHLDWDERVFAIVDFLQKPIDLEYNESVARHNYNLIYDKKFILSLINIPE